MANIDTTSINELIAAFRNMQAKDSITPESLGSLLQQITDLLATATSQDAVQTLTSWYEALANAQKYISALSVGSNSAAKCCINAIAVNPKTGQPTNLVDHLELPLATRAHAGVMTAEQVQLMDSHQDLFDEDVFPMLNVLENKVAKLESTAPESAALKARAQIHAEVVGYTLYVRGSASLLNAGYVPYLFRHTTKVNRDRDHPNSSGKPTKGPLRKGWNLFGSMHSVKIVKDEVRFSTNRPYLFHEPTEEYSTEPEYLVHPKRDKLGRFETVPWGKRIIYQFDEKAQFHRMLRLRYAIGFGKPFHPGKKRFSTLDLVSNLAEFSVIFEPMIKQFMLSR